MLWAFGNSHHSSRSILHKSYRPQLVGFREKWPWVWDWAGLQGSIDNETIGKIFFFVFYLWRKRSKEVERKRKEKRKERNTRRQRIGDWSIKEERKALFPKTLPLSSQFNNIQHRKGAGMDKNMLAGLDGLPEQDKARMAAMIDHLQLRDRFWFFSHFALLVSLIFRFYISCSWIYCFFLDWIKKKIIISQPRWILLPFFIKKDSFLCFSLFLWNSTLGFSFGFHLWLCMWNLCNASCKLSFCSRGLVDMWS